MTASEDLFLDFYNQLNERQQEAVDHIYGPVMVIAGPGTGKTQVLGMRIANLLRSDAQVQPHELLCLTYTEEATNSMRRRLVQIMGPAAHKVNIFTFHAFCNNIIQNHSDNFSRRSLQPISDFERTELIYKMLEELPPGHLLRRFGGNIYFDTGKIGNLFDMMKKEYLSPGYVSESIDEYIASLPTREEYIYKKNGKGYKKGELKQVKIDEETRKMEESRAAALLFTDFEKRMTELGLYDFNDMIIWVLEAFKQNAALLQNYQERYQFIMVDEFQDTNGAQNELVNLLCAYWEDPNIFVVGDDDQSIYEFQGARIRNIIDFYERYKESVKVVVLPHNYRSSQLILDKAMAIIGNNKRRLINQLHELHLDKNIIAAAPRFKNSKENVKPVVKVYTNILQEEADTVMEIERLQQAGVPLGNVAIIYAQHKQATNLIDLMERKGIPFNVKKPENILGLPLTGQILNIMRYLDRERRKPFDGEDILFEIMHSPYFEILPTDIAALAIYMQSSKKDKNVIYWKRLISNPLLLETLFLDSAKTMTRLGNNLDLWERQQTILPLPLLVEKIVHESGIVAHLLKATDNVWQIQALYTLFEFVKETYAKNNKIRPPEFLKMVEQMIDEGIQVPFQRVIQNENGVHFFTAHGAKGNEFEYVYLIGCTKNFWEKKKGRSGEYRMPDTITSTEEDNEKTYKTEVARRLFYVALTRAKKYLQVSYANTDNKGKSIEPSVFVDEISAQDERVMYKVASGDLMAHMEWAMKPVPDVRIKMANANWVDRVLKQFSLSYSALSKYLNCELAFYYENILKVPFQNTDARAFGISVHYALERLFLDMKKNGVFPEKAAVLSAFRYQMKNESSCFTPVQYERRLEQGHTVLSDYYDTYIDQLPTEVEIEFKIPRYHLQGVPVTGKIDRIELNGNSCKVVDYKTGDPDKSPAGVMSQPGEKSPNGGDYWRQMVFYKLLIENYEEKSWRMTEGKFEYVQKGKDGTYKHKLVPIFAKDEETVLAQLKDAYTRIMNHEFDKGCGNEKCHWCNFAKNYELVRPGRDEVELEL